MSAGEGPPRVIERVAREWDFMNQPMRRTVLYLGGEPLWSNEIPLWRDLDERLRVAALFGLRRAAALGDRAARALEGR